MLGPGGQLGHPFNGTVDLVDLGQGHGQTLEPVDATGAGIEVNGVPAVQNGCSPFFQPPFLHHAGPEAAEMLDVHGIHGAAVRVHADQVIFLFGKCLQGHSGSSLQAGVPAVTEHVVLGGAAEFALAGDLLNGGPDVVALGAVGIDEGVNLGQVNQMVGIVEADGRSGDFFIIPRQFQTVLQLHRTRTSFSWA